jgi:hypothetical protein
LTEQRDVLIRVYRGSQTSATRAFEADAAKLAQSRYFPASQSWAPGSYGCGAFLIALLLCFIFIGFLIFVYMIIVKPEGSLTVTYELRAASLNSPPRASAEEKTCPRCAEQVKAAAVVCRFCGYEFK